MQEELIAPGALTLPDFPEPAAALSADDRGEIYFPTSSPFDLQEILRGGGTTPTTGLGYLTFPKTKGEKPAPALVILPGSGGIKPGREHAYAAFLNGIGIAGFVIDYYASRGLAEETDYLLRTAQVTEFDLVADAYAALEHLSTHPGIDGARIGLVGFSYGGMAARHALDERIRLALAPEHPGFKLHIDIYGPCFQALGTSATNGAPLLSLRGAKDASNDPAACRKRERELRKLGVAVEAIVYEGAGHAWENAEPRSFSAGSPYIQGCEWHYDEQGRALLDGKRLFTVAAGASRAERVAARLHSGARLGHCVKRGYIIGRDEAVRERAFADAADFLGRHL